MRKIGLKIQERVFVTADLHLFHNNMLKWESMPYRNIFTNTHEMHQKMIENWNSVVNDNDIVYILGDICFRNGKYAIDILKQLKGRKRLILGNHDKYNEIKKIEHLFEFVDFYETINYHYKDEYHHIIMFHYPISNWDRKHYKSIHVFGHTHGNYENGGRSIDVGLDTEIAKFFPVLLDDVIDLMDNE